MKKQFTVPAFGSILAGVVLFLAASCGSKESFDGTHKVSVLDLGSALSFDAASPQEVVFTLEALEDWTIRKNALDWLSITPTGGGKGTFTVRLTAQPNDRDEPREGDLVISSPTFSKSVSVSQSAGEVAGALELSGLDGNIITVSAWPGDYAFGLFSNLDWSASTRELDWATLTPAEGGKRRTAALVMHVDENEVRQGRTGFIDITLSDGSKTTVTVVQEAFEAVLDLSASSMIVSATGVSYPESVGLTANAAWTSAPDASWLTVAPEQAPEGAYQVRITAAPNPTGQDRQAKVVFDNRGLRKELTVTQYWETLDVSTRDIPLNYQGTGASVEGASNQVALTASGPWEAVCDPWITVSPSSGNGDAVLTVTAGRNDIAPRTGQVTITCGRLTETVTVRQEFNTAGYVDLAREPLVWLSSGLRASVLAGSPEWETRGIALPLTHGDLAYCEWTLSDESQAIAFDPLFVVASDGNLISRNNWTDDALVFHVPVYELTAGQAVCLYFGMKGIRNQPAYWSVEIFVDGTWVPMDTGSSFTSSNLRRAANIFLTSTDAQDCSARYVLEKDIAREELMLRIRVADGTYSIQGLILTKVAGKSSAMRFLPGEGGDPQGMTLRIE